MVASSEAIRESDRDHRIKTQECEIPVESALHGLNVALKNWIRSSVSAVATALIADATSNVQNSLRRAAKNESDLQRNSETAVTSGEKAAKAREDAGRDSIEVKLSGSNDGVRGIASKINVIDRKHLSAGRRAVHAHPGSVVDQQARTDVERSPKRSPVVLRLYGFQVEVTGARRSVLVKILAIAEEIEGRTYPRAITQLNPAFDAQPKRRGLHPDDVVVR